MSNYEFPPSGVFLMEDVMTEILDRPPEEIDYALEEAESVFRHMLEDDIMADEQKIAVMAGEKSINEIRSELQLAPLDEWVFNEKLFFEPSGYCPVLSEACIREAYVHILQSKSVYMRDFLKESIEIRTRNLIEFFGIADGFCDF